MVLGAGLLLVLVQIGFRAWALAHGYFYGDDYEFLTDATGRGLSVHGLVEPHAGHLMPGGLLLSWVLAHAGAFNWSAAVVLLVVLQLAASLCCLWMLVRLFGTRWQVLPLLALYLFSSLTLTGYMWWAAAINQLPAQIAFFVAVTLHVEHLRTRRLRHALGTAVMLVAGLLFYEKVVLVVGPLFFLTVLWFPRRSTGHLRRARQAVRTYWRALALYAVVAGGYLAYYLTQVPSPVAGDGPVPYGDVADAMVRRSLGTALVGGPWHWSSANAPLGLVDAPDWAVTGAWVLLALGIAHVVHARRADWRAALLVVPWVFASFVLTAQSRGATFGGVVGLELRYLADAAPVLTLAIGLFCLRLAERETPPAAVHAATPADHGRWRRGLVVAGVLALVAGAAVTNVRYVAMWREPFAAKTFTRNVIDQSREAPLRVADEPVPDAVLGGAIFPANLPSRMFRPLGDRVVALDRGNDLDILGTDGGVYPPIVAGGAESAPGPATNCGYAVDSSAAVPVEMTGAPQQVFWWLEISYLSAGDGTLTVSIDGTEHEVELEQGTHRFFLKGEGSVQDLSMSSSDTAVCVDRVSVGDISAVEPL